MAQIGRKNGDVGLALALARGLSVKDAAELRPYLEDVWHLASEGETYFITRYRNPTQNLRTQLTKIIKRAGMEPWPKLWQNLRASRQTELEKEFPLHVVCAWIGNSERVARKHYLQITDDHFEEAVRGARSIFVASTAPQGVVNEKCDTLETARTSKVSPCVALSMGSTGFEPARDLTPTRPSTWRVCQFRHEPARL